MQKSGEQADFIKRVASEKHLIEYLKSEKKEEYIPLNYYGIFLRDRIMNKGKDVKVNKKFFRTLYEEVWLQEMGKDIRDKYRKMDVWSSVL